jgi:hypothetical protein
MQPFDSVQNFAFYMYLDHLIKIDTALDAVLMFNFERPIITLVLVGAKYLLSTIISDLSCSNSPHSPFYLTMSQDIWGSSGQAIALTSKRIGVPKSLHLPTRLQDLKYAAVGSLLITNIMMSLFMQMQNRDEHFPNAITIATAPPQCSECKFLRRHWNLHNFANGTLPKVVRMHGGQYGRTGNVIILMLNAMKLAYICKVAIELLLPDDSDNVFQLQEGLFDFTQRPGEASTDFQCEQDVDMDYGDFYWLFSKTDLPMDAHVLNKLWDCMQQFLGFCVQGFCKDHQATQDGVLVVHLRQGDIYPPDFDQGVYSTYQQLSLAYYFSIINFSNPEKVIFVVEDNNHGPVWDAFEQMHSYGMTEQFDIEFQPSNFREDMLTMLHAQKFVESVFTLMIMIRLSFAVQRFSFSCQVACCGVQFFQGLPNMQQVYLVDPGQFAVGFHSNSAKEWVAMLLGGKSPSPVLCDV